MTPKQLYAMPPTRIEKEIYSLDNHIDVPFSWSYENNTRIELRYYAEHTFDGERCFNFFSVWFDDKPVMICQEAGRGGRDHQDEFITNKKLYWEMIGYIQTLSDEKEYDNNNYYKEEEEISDLDNFYGANILEFYDPELKPKYKIGDIVIAKVPKNHGYFPEMIETKVEIRRIYPMNPTSTYWGRQTSRSYVTNKIISVKDGEGTQGAILNDSLIIEKVGEFDPQTLINNNFTIY